MKKLLFLLIITGFLASCNKSEERRAEDDNMIQEYLADNGIDAIKLEDSGVYYRITEEGIGEDFPNLNSTIRVFYKGYLMDGTVFDQRIEGENDYLEDLLGNMVFGWRVALPNFSKKAKGEIYVPSHAGYGSSELPGIPANSILIFEVYLFNVF